MQKSDSLHSRLAREEATLAATHEQIDSAERRIEALRGEIESAKQQIEAGQEQLEGLREQARSIEKRISLLRQYLAMAEASDLSIEASAQPKNNSEPIVAGDAEADVSAESDVEDELTEISFVEPFDPPPASTTSPSKRLLSFEELDDETLTLELLPRTQTFEEELLLVMAHHRKAVAPKDVSRVFRRLDYTPKLTGSERTLRQRIEAARHLFEFTGEGRIALTREGRDEAKRLLEQLL